MGIYEDLLARDAKLIPGGAAQNTARGAQVWRSFFRFDPSYEKKKLTNNKVHASRELSHVHWLHW